MCIRDSLSRSRRRQGDGRIHRGLAAGCSARQGSRTFSRRAHHGRDHRQRDFSTRRQLGDGRGTGRYCRFLRKAPAEFIAGSFDCSGTTWRQIESREWDPMAERVGFEPTMPPAKTASMSHRSRCLECILLLGDFQKQGDQPIVDIVIVSAALMFANKTCVRQRIKVASSSLSSDI